MRNHSISSLRVALWIAVLMPFSGAARAATGIAPLAQKVLKNPDDWFKSSEARSLADSLLTWQNANGGWWKNYDATKPRPAATTARTNDGPAGDTEDVWQKVSTFDNGATYSEMRILARANRMLDRESYRDSFNRGLKYLFDSQYANGGWPQRFPLQNNYGRHITFNDDAMVGVMDLLKDIVDGKPDFAFVTEADRKRSQEAFDRGVECILKCQIKVHGKLTAWCQQHDEVTFEPAKARSYELPSICGDESAGITLVLMREKNPDTRVREAIEAAVAWYDAAKISGKRYDKVFDASGKLTDRVLIDDPSAAIWARFYDLETGKPFFCNRDGIKRDSLDQVAQERRAGYQWYGDWGLKLPEAYRAWKQQAASAGR